MSVPIAPPIHRVPKFDPEIGNTQDFVTPKATNESLAMAIGYSELKPRLRMTKLMPKYSLVGGRIPWEAVINRTNAAAD